MLFYNSVGPNPRVVRLFMAERGIDLPRTEIDLRGGENRQPPYLAKNPAGQMPCLELDDGAVITEITAICEYLDEITPGPSLIGATARERAETRMWTRRIDLNIVEPLANGFRFSQGLKLFQNRIRCIPQAADDLKATAQERLAWLDGLIAGLAIHLRRPAEPGRHHAVRLPGLRCPGRPADQSRAQGRHGAPRDDGGAALRRRLTGGYPCFGSSCSARVAQ